MAAADYDQELYISDEEKEKRYDPTLQLLFVNSAQEDPSIPLSAFKVKMTEVIERLIERFGEQNIEFHLSDDKLGYQKTLNEILDGTHVRREITETNWTHDRRVPQIEIFKQRNVEMMNKLVDIKNNYTNTVQLVIAMDTPTNHSSINHNSDLAKENNIPYTYFSLDMDINYFLDNHKTMTPRKKYHAKRPLAYPSSHKEPMQQQKRFRPPPNPYLPQQSIPLIMTQTMPMAQAMPIFEKPTYELNAYGRIKTMIIRVTFPE
jgi:hypothetical protein